MTNPTAEDYQHIKEKLVDYLSHQGFSEKKLLQKVTDLKRRYPRTKRYFFYTPENVQQVIDELKGIGLIDDRKYAEEVLRQLKDRKDGLYRIRQKMQRRMIPQTIIDDVLQQWQEQGAPQDLSAIIRETRRKLERLRLKYPHKKDQYTINTKLYAFLAQKGYASDEVRDILKKVQ